jgi:hypothetical protein
MLRMILFRDHRDPKAFRPCALDQNLDVPLAALESAMVFVSRQEKPSKSPNRSKIRGCDLVRAGYAILGPTRLRPAGRCFRFAERRSGNWGWITAEARLLPRTRIGRIPFPTSQDNGLQNRCSWRPVPN